MAWTTPGTATAGEVLTAAFWNEQVRDNLTELAPFFGAWTDFNPSFSQGAELTVTKRRARYLSVGKLVIVQVSVEFTSAGTGGSDITFVLPVAPASISSGWDNVGTAFFFDDNTSARYSLHAMRFDNTAVFFQHGGTTANSAFGGGPAVTIASGDEMTLKLVYEAA